MGQLSIHFKKAVIGACTVSTLLCANPLQQAIADVLPRASTTGKPNFITIVLDDMGFSDLGSFGSEIPTPNLDQLANTGIILNNFYAAPTSTPSRAMLFTGKDHHQSGVGNMPTWVRPEQRDRQGHNLAGYEGLLPEYVLPFTEVLQNTGYHNMMVGKWDLGEEPEYYPSKRGIDQTFVLLPGGDTYFLSDAQGKLVTTFDANYYANLGLESPYNQNGVEFKDFPPNAYATTYYTDKTLEILDSRDKSKPFYLNLSYITPHDPYQAPADVTAKYLAYYERGWDVIREERFTRQKQLGFWTDNLQLPARPENVPAWDSLTDEQKRYETKRMAIYAAMLDILDQNIGRVVQHLKDIGEYDNTVIFVHSDNGGPFSAAGSPAYQAYVAKNFDNSYENIGNIKSLIGSSPGWGMVMNTPLNQYKGDTFDGGVRTAAFVHYPQSKISGVKYSGLTSVMDISATILDMAGAQYPYVYKDRPNTPMQGISMAGLFSGQVVSDPERWLAWELDSAKGVRKGNWKLSQKWIPEQNRWDENWYLFNLTIDPFERNNLSTKEPEKFAELLKVYRQYAEQNSVIEISGKIINGDLGGLINSTILSDARITGGTAVNYLYFNQKTTPKTTDLVEVEASIQPAKEHIGLPANIFVQVTYTPPEGTPVKLMFKQDGSATLWDDASILPFFSVSALTKRVPVPIYQGILSLPGKVDILLGYQLSDGTMVKSEKPITITVGS
ncbi:arylsulfatase [Beggiatoa leptomitoformis]|uniref:Sulfatase-like hydrolase/transferase n=1 Tax=Beggiatoa leptomitoformis TaxID=288004 RepID=A0A2N9YBD6_9GAMM|nr:arylsulfatase [Beggiatoa leptomitoformis]ALG66856.1 sulfatase-like hydrolase/transferase [Beggiatoa leptomitoformis]AUI67790.1 sulfatase-like hydrolase/transferase [Beggiatoa leptomitoformis]